MTCLSTCAEVVGVALVILFVAPVVLLSTLSALFAEPGAGKARAQRLEGDARSLRNRRHISSLLAGAAAAS